MKDFLGIFRGFLKVNKKFQDSLQVLVIFWRNFKEFYRNFQVISMIISTNDNICNFLRRFFSSFLTFSWFFLDFWGFTAIAQIKIKIFKIFLGKFRIFSRILEVEKQISRFSSSFGDFWEDFQVISVINIDKWQYLRFFEAILQQFMNIFAIFSVFRGFSKMNDKFQDSIQVLRGFSSNFGDKYRQMTIFAIFFGDSSAVSEYFRDFSKSRQRHELLFSLRRHLKRINLRASAFIAIIFLSRKENERRMRRSGTNCHFHLKIWKWNLSLSRLVLLLVLLLFCFVIFWIHLNNWIFQTNLLRAATSDQSNRSWCHRSS